MQRPGVSALLVALALAALCAPGRARSPLPGAPGPAAQRALEAAWLDPRGPAPHQRPLRLPGPPPPPAERTKKQGPWLEEEEEAYGWMDFGRRSAEDGDPQA